MRKFRFVAVALRALLEAISSGPLCERQELMLAKTDGQQMTQLRVLAGRNALLCWEVMTTIPWPGQKAYTSIKKHCKQVTHKSRCIPLHVITEYLSHSELHGFG